MKKYIAIMLALSLFACKKKSNKSEEEVAAPAVNKSWQVVKHDSTRTIKKILFSGSDYGYFISDENYLLRTKNGGKSFSVLMLPVDYMLLGATLVDSMSLILTYNYNTFKTTDGGQTWTALETSTLSSALFDGCFINSQLGFIGSSNCILKTEDGGSTWQKLEIGTGSFYQVKFTSASTGWADNGSGVAYRTTDGGNTWTPHATGFTNNSYMFFLNDNVAWAWNADIMNLGVTLKRTLDGGSTWTVIYTSSTVLPWASLAFLNEEQGFSGSLGGYIYSGTKGGVSWVQDAYQSDSRSLYNLVALPNGNIWGAGEDGLIIKYE